VRLLHQYILKQFLGYLLVSVLFFAGVLLMGNVMKNMMGLIVGGKLSLGHCFTLVVMLLPSMVSYALPFGFVTATLLTVGNLSSDREYMALKSLGIRPSQIFLSILVLASCGVFLSLVVNFEYAPRAISGVKAKLQNIIREEPLRFIVPQKFIYDFPGYIIFVKSIDRGHLNDFCIYELGEGERVVSYIQAKTGTLEYDSRKNALVLTLEEGTVERKIGEGKIAPLITFEKLSLDLQFYNIFKEMRTQKKNSPHDTGGDASVEGGKY
jgi:lipopolysaccharide export system permease protein